MTTKRRSLNAAMDLSPEAAAFIRGNSGGEVPPAAPVEPSRQPPMRVPVPEPTQAGPVAPIHEVVRNEDKRVQNPIELDNVVESPGADRKRVRSRSRVGETPRQEAAYGMANLLVPLTTRLSPSTAAALKRAGLEQKLYGRQPSTVQEIAEVAIQNWLQENGYV